MIRRVRTSWGEASVLVSDGNIHNFVSKEPLRHENTYSQHIHELVIENDKTTNLWVFGVAVRNVRISKSVNIVEEQASEWES